MNIRQLASADAARWKDFRLNMLREAPTSFCAVAEDLVDRPLNFFETWLQRHTVFVAEADGQWLGSVAWAPNSSPVTRHRGEVSAVYVRPEARGQGVLDALLAAVVADARGKVVLLELEVNATLNAAHAAYLRNGWTDVARLPQHMKHGEVISDAFRMMRTLSGGA